jgi:phosphoglucomutase
MQSYLKIEQHQEHIPSLKKIFSFDEIKVLITGVPVAILATDSIPGKTSPYKKYSFTRKPGLLFIYTSGHNRHTQRRNAHP